MRFAPSPTGYLHIGSARTALFNWLYARKIDGAFILRIEDTDRERSEAKFEQNILEGLEWLGLKYDEFCHQSKRLEIYESYIKKLLDEGKAFFCGHSVEELGAEAKIQRNSKKNPCHVCPDRERGLEEGIIRFKNDSKETIKIKDVVRGEILYDASVFGDFSLAKSIREPLYNFAATIDDNEMKISHVIRGEDHISNTPKQILLELALGFAEPLWVHLPLLLGQDRSKLSKRHGALSVHEYREAGYLPEAMINFMALLGWHPKDEVGELLGKETLIREFSLERIQKGGAIVSHEKLDWFNRMYLKKNILLLMDLVPPEIEKDLEPDSIKKAVELAAERITKTADLGPLLQEITSPPSYEKDLLLWNGKITARDAAIIIDELIDLLSNLDPAKFRVKDLENTLTPLMEKNGKGRVLWPFRAALSGKTASFGPFDLSEIIGKNNTLKRLREASHIVRADL